MQDPEVLADVVKEIGHYFDSNSTPDCNTGVVWEAHKAVIMGVLIKHGSRLKQQRTAQLTSLLDKLQTLETNHKQILTRQLGIELDTVCTQVTDLLRFKAKAALQICRRKIYECGNKCGRLLAQSLQAERLASYIPHIISSTGQKASLPLHIVQEFRSFHTSLYNLNTTPPTPDATSEYITTSLMPSLPTEAKDLLEDPITGAWPGRQWSRKQAV